MTLCVADFAEPEIVSWRVDSRTTAPAAPIRPDVVVRRVTPAGFWLLGAQFFCSFADVRSPRAGVITQLEDGYEVLQPIPYRVSRQGEQDFIATFEEGNIAISGVDPHDAYQSLLADILDTFDSLVAAPRLSPAAVRQLNVLREFIRRG